MHENNCYDITGFQSTVAVMLNKESILRDSPFCYMDFINQDHVDQELNRYAVTELSKK